MLTCHGSRPRLTSKPRSGILFAGPPAEPYIRNPPSLEVTPGIPDLSLRVTTSLPRNLRCKMQLIQSVARVAAFLGLGKAFIPNSLVSRQD